MPTSSKENLHQVTHEELTNCPAEKVAPEILGSLNSRTKRQLLRDGAVERIRHGLSLAGASVAIDAFLADIERHSAYLDRCSIEAEAVLRGNLAAANRLWLLLQTPVGSRLPLPASILGDGAHDILRRAPTAMDGEVLLRLVAGVTRAANQPSEAELMLKTLGQLLQPLFQLDLAAAAIERARQGHAEMLETLVTAQLTPQLLDEVTHRNDPIQIRDQPFAAGKAVLDPNRVPFDSTSWLQLSPLSPIDHWGALWPCIRGVHLSMSQIDRFGVPYHIDSISPADACRGQRLTILGRDFGPAGRVAFPAPAANDPIFSAGIEEAVLIGVTPTSWTSTRIEVVVPNWATAGPLNLSAVTRHEDPCATIDVYRLGNSVLFQGGLASVYQVSLDGVDLDLSGTDALIMPLNRTMTLSWHASGGPSARVEIQVADDTRVLVKQSNLPAGFGSITFDVPITEPEQPRIGHLTFSTFSLCGETPPLDLPVWLTVLPRLTIEYVEVTQGVQTDLADVLAGRGMPTVANKDTAVRVHMQCDRGGWFSNQLANITGALWVDGRKLPPTNVANIAGFSNANRTNDTLNFSIPAAWLTKGAHALSVKVVCNDRSGKIEVQQSFQWTWYAKDPFRVRAIYMAEGGSDLEMLDYTRKALDFLPTDLSNIGIASRHSYPNPNKLVDYADWSDLQHNVEKAWDEADEESGVRWLGIVPASAVPPNAQFSGMSGTPSIAVVAISNAPQVGAHELGHSLGLRHVDLPMGGPGEPAPPWDSVDNFGFLRRPGFDVRTNQAVPLPAADLMSYLQPQGMGITNWMKLFNGFGDR